MIGPGGGMVQMGGGGGGGPQGGNGELLQELLGGGGGGGPGRGPGGPGGGPGGANFIEQDGPDGSTVIEIDGPIPQDMRSSMPVGMLRDLFPGPVQMDPRGPAPVVKDGRDAKGGHPLPFDRPDPVIMNMMQDLNKAFTNDMLPAIQKAAGADKVPNACQKEIEAHCQGAKSQLHCLGGKDYGQISQECRNDVGKSVPFVCSTEIDKYCDVLEKGILSCLGEHVKDLNGPCRDSVTATQHVIKKANTQKVSLPDPLTGQRRVSVPSRGSGALPAAGQPSREATLDARLAQMASGVPGATPAKAASQPLAATSLLSSSTPNTQPAPSMPNSASASAAVAAQSVPAAKEQLLDTMLVQRNAGAGGVSGKAVPPPASSLSSAVAPQRLPPGLEPAQPPGAGSSMKWLFGFLLLGGCVFALTSTDLSGRLQSSVRSHSKKGEGSEPLNMRSSSQMELPYPGEHML